MHNLPHTIAGVDCCFSQWSTSGSLLFANKAGYYYELCPNLDFVYCWNDSVHANIHPLDLPGINKDKYMGEGEVVIKVIDRKNNAYNYVLKDDKWVLR